MKLLNVAVVASVLRWGQETGRKLPGGRLGKMQGRLTRGVESW